MNGKYSSTVSSSATEMRGLEGDPRFKYRMVGVFNNDERSATGIQIKKRRERFRVHALVNRPGVEKQSYTIL